MKTQNLITNMRHILSILMILVILSAALPASAAPIAQEASENAGQQSAALLSGMTERVSVASDGTQGGGDSAWPIISADGRYVAFVSCATNLVAWDTNGHWDVFVRDRATGQTTLVSVASNGTQGNSGAGGYPSISADGRYVAFNSEASNLVSGDTNGTWDIFVHDRTTRQTTRVSLASDGTQGNGGSYTPAISADGRYVAFYSWASNLVSGDTNGVYDTFVHDRTTGQTTLVSVASDGTPANSDSADPSISADGRYVAFRSIATNLVSGDTNGSQDIFVHDLTTGQTTRVSVASDGTQGNDESLLGGSISSDGRYVAFFSLASNLVSGDTNGVYDTFVHDRTTGQTTRVSVASDGTQGNDESGWYPSISADGRYVAFRSTASNLVSGDTNGVWDVFVHDRTTGQTRRVSLATNGTQGNGSSGETAISADGRYVAFYSWANNLVSGDTNGASDIFVHALPGNMLTVGRSGTGSGTVTSDPPGIDCGADCQEDFTYGTVVTLTAQAAAGSTFNGWIGDCTGVGQCVLFIDDAKSAIAAFTLNGYLLTVGRSGTGSGTVTSLPPGIDCGADCQETFTYGTVVTLTAQAAAGSAFAGWSGDCTGTGQCAATMDQTRLATATFNVLTGTTERVSLASDGSQGYAHSWDPSISADGRYVAFDSGATNLVDGDTNGTSDVFVRDRATRQTTRLSLASDGTQGNNSSEYPSISADGRYVAFESGASNLVSGDTNGYWDIFVHDQTTGQTTLASVASDGTQGNGNSADPSISADGRYVAFRSIATNLVSGDTNGSQDIFVHDLTTGQTQRVSVASDGTQGDTDSYEPSLSADGRYVAFNSYASNLVSGDTNYRADVFIHDRTTGQTTRLSLASSGTQGDDDSFWPFLSADGRYVAFESYASNLVEGDSNEFCYTGVPEQPYINCPDIFVHDLMTGQTTRVSVASDGTQGNNYSNGPSISADGRYVAFSSLASTLVSRDTNGWDVFVHDRTTGQTTRVSLASDGTQGNGNSAEEYNRPSISADGCYVAFQSYASNLVSGDTNGASDIFVHTLQGNLLAVGRSGTGSGTVTSDPPGIDCGLDCQEDFTYGTVVNLTAQAAASSTFAGWSGDCTGTGQCVANMDQTRSVTATFTLNDYLLIVGRSGTGSGTVSSLPPGIDCGADCQEDFTYGTVVTLTAQAAAGSTFTGWISDCTGPGQCVLTIDDAKSAIADFTLNEYPLSVGKSGTGSGTVTSDPPGIDCGADCQEDFTYGTVVTLTAQAAVNSAFTGWSGDCSGTGACVLTITQPYSVTADFKGDYKLYLPIIRNTAGAANLPIESSPVALLYAAPLTTTSPNLLQDAFAWLRLLLSLMDSVV